MGQEPPRVRAGFKRRLSSPRWDECGSDFSFSSALSARRRRLPTRRSALAPRRSATIATDVPGVRRHITVAALPPPFASQSSAKWTAASWRRPAGAKLRARPPGFTVDAVRALGSCRPRVLRVAPNGDIFVAESEARPRPHPARQKDGVAAPETNPKSSPTASIVRSASPFTRPARRRRFVYIAENTPRRALRLPQRPGDILNVARQSRGHRRQAHRQQRRPLDARPRLLRLMAKQLFVRGLAPAPTSPKAWTSARPPTSSACEAAEGLGATWGDERHRADVLVFDPAGQSGRQGLRQRHSQLRVGLAGAAQYLRACGARRK